MGVVTACCNYLKRGGVEGGRLDSRSETVVLEYVSADPGTETTLAQARIGLAGDVLWRTLRYRGTACLREYYVNDLRRRGELSEPAGGLDTEALQQIGVQFDRFVLESELVESGKLDALMRRLRDACAVEVRAGETWLLSTAYGDVQDRVLLRSDGTPTYLAVDVAYHVDKMTRGHRLVNLWDSLHANYVARTLAALAAAGEDPARLEIAIVAPVRVVDTAVERRNGPAGGAWTLREILAEGGPDALRWRLLSFPLAEEAWVDLATLASYPALDRLRMARAISMARNERDPALIHVRNKADALEDAIDQTVRHCAPQRLSEYLNELVDVVLGAGRITNNAVRSLETAVDLLGLSEAMRD